MDPELKSKGQGHQNLFFQKWTKTGIFSLFTPILVSIAEDDKKINNMVIDNYVFSMDS